MPGLRLTTIWAMNAQTIKNTTLSAVWTTVTVMGHLQSDETLAEGLDG